MKKFLLFAFVAVATLNASAIERMKKSPFPKEQKKALVRQDAHVDILRNKIAYQLPQAQKFPMDLKFAKKADEKPISLRPAFSTGTYRYSELIGGFSSQAIYEGASFYVDKEAGKAFFKPFDFIPGLVVGDIVTDKVNQYSEQGYDSITFDCSEYFATYTTEEGEQELYLLPSDLEGSRQEGYRPVRTANTKFGAYYISEYDPEEDATYTNLYIDEILAVYMNEETAPMYDFLVLAGLDLRPMEEVSPYVSKAIVSTNNPYGERYNFTNEDAMVLMSSTGYYIKGVDSFDPDAWVEFKVDAEDQTIFTVADNQYIGVFSFYTDATRTTTYDVLVTTCGYVWNGTKVTGYAPNDDASFKSTDVGEVTELKNTDNTLYGDYGWAEGDEERSDEEKKSGLFDAAELTITILYEDVELGVAGVKSNAPKSNARYNLAGQRVDKNYKGIVIENGKKYNTK